MNDASKNLERREYELLKDRLYRASNALQLSLESCPELENTYVQLPDGHKLFPAEIFSWLNAVRSSSWKYGPTEVQLRHIKNLVKQQPKG
ncbi:MAG TPA: hypothetical protein VH280_14930 [Verrucomicrobiae bacterium]|jgi:hypothetical protein|nr:hypothetical protein [Verrucomicrobiae bacterium]